MVLLQLIKTDNMLDFDWALNLVYNPADSYTKCATM